MKRNLLVVLALVCSGVLSLALGTAANRRHGALLAHTDQTSSALPAPTSRQAGSPRRVPQTRENFDIRAGHKRSLEVPPDEITSATSRKRIQSQRQNDATRFKLQREHSAVQLRWSSLATAPSRVWSLSEPLSEPTGEDAEVAARRFLKSNDDLFRLGTDDIDRLRVARRERGEHNGVTHLTFRQQVAGIEVFEGELSVHLDRAGAVLATSGEVIPGAAKAVNLSRPSLAAAEALRLAAQEADTEIIGSPKLRKQANGADAWQSFERAASFDRDVEAKLVYFPVAADQLRLGWQFTLWMRGTADVYLMVIDAERGSLLYRHNLTCYEDNPLKPHGLAFTGESPRPNLPRNSVSPIAVDREDWPFRAAPFNGSEIFKPGDRHYDWWNGAVADSLVSNNADVALDADADNQPDLPRLKATDGNFTFPFDPAQEPASSDNRRAAQANLFYWINRYHDILYSFGFTEKAGNYQANNLGLGGAEGDPIQGDVQDGSGINNANFTTPPDGGAGRVQMYLWSGSPRLDSAFDQSVILHELTHGVSSRLIGNATGLSAMQSIGMGEGWSDYFALALLVKEGDDPAGAYPIAQYSCNNYQHGIRRYPYSTNLAVNPLTFGKIAVNSEVHAVGEIWCGALWEVRALLVGKYGFQEGQRQSLQLVVDGMKLTPRAPTFIDARNAILLADRVNNGGANQCLLWQAFAKRGLGYSAETADANDAAPVEAFDLVPWCSDTGSVRLDRENYLNGELVQITLADHNAQAPVTVEVSSSVTGDHETVTLAPEPETQGSFKGAVRLVAGGARAGDGELQASVEAGDQIVIAYDDALSSGGNVVQMRVTAAVAREKTVFEDSVEQGNQGWISNGSWGITGARSASSSHCWTDSPDGNYLNAVSTSLTSPLFDLSGLSDVTLAMAHSFLLDNGLDAAIVEYSNNDGATWSRATAFTGTQAGFAQAQIRLRGLDGQARARIRFRLASDARESADGWYLDDLRLTGRSANPQVVPPNGAISPFITAISPAFGDPAGGTRVTISGAGFTEDADTVVTFDGRPATSVTVLSGTTITAVTPPHSAGAVIVRVVNRNGEGALGNGFTYYASDSGGGAPTLVSVFPASGSMRGGTAVTLYGSNFTPETSVAFGAQSCNVTFINANTLRALTPPVATTGTVDVNVGNGAMLSKLAGAFSYTAITPPAVEVLKPGGETLYAGSTVNINWRSSDNRAVAGHRIRLCQVVGTTTQVIYEIAAGVAGESQSYAWTIPADLPPVGQARIGVTAIDDEGTQAEAYSGGTFAIERRWDSVAQLPTVRQNFAVVSDGRALYSIGGRPDGDPATATNELLRFDPAAARALWRGTGLAPMPVAESGADAVFLNGKIYVPGGLSTGNQALRKHQVYDIAANSWDLAAELPAAVTSYALATDEQRQVYYLTGGNEPGNLTSAASKVRAYDAANDVWSELPPMQTPRYGHEAAMIDGKLYVIGGAGPSGALAGGEVYDFSTGRWSPIAPLNHPRIFATGAPGKDESGNPLWFVIGGWDGSDALAGVEVYDVRRNRWIALDDSFNPPTPRVWLSGAALGGYFYAVGGSTMSRVTGGGLLVMSQRANERLRVDGVTPTGSDQAPVLSVPPAQVAVAGSEISFTVSANDLGSGVPMTIITGDLPAGASFTAASASNNSMRGTFRWSPAASDTGQTFAVSFTASDGQLSDTKLVSVRVIEGGRLTAVNAADFSQGALAADSIAAVFGTGLAPRPQFAETQPLPLELAGTRLAVNGIPAALLFVSPTQINFVMPAGVNPGTAGIVVSNPAGGYAVGAVEIVAASPALFTADATGRGDAAAIATPDGITYQSAPFDVTINARPNNLVLYGTGMRRALAAKSSAAGTLAEAVSVRIGGEPARVLYAGAQGGYSGLDQINVELPPSLAGKGERRVEVVLTVDGVAANRVTVLIR